MFGSELSKRRRVAPARSSMAVSIVLALLALAVMPAWAVPAEAAQPFPELIPLPNGFQPEGIVSGRGTDFYVGSLAPGAIEGEIYKGDLRTGEGAVLVPPYPDRVAVGLAFDLRTDYLFVAGGPTGMAYVYDAETGADVMEYVLSTSVAKFINDVVITQDAAYFTNSFDDVLYRLPLAPNGALPDASAVEEIDLPDEFAEPGFNANGIEATDNGKLLVLVRSRDGTLHRFDAESHEIIPIELGGETLPNGDGLLLHGKTLYVVQNRLNQISVVELEPDLLSGQVAGTLTDEDFDVPTTVTEFGNRLYAVNARFGTPDPDLAEYDVVKLCRR
jgi:hypothetical protein